MTPPSSSKVEELVRRSIGDLHEADKQRDDGVIGEYAYKSAVAGVVRSAVLAALELAAETCLRQKELHGIGLDAAWFAKSIRDLASIPSEKPREEP